MSVKPFSFSSRFLASDLVIDVIIVIFFLSMEKLLENSSSVLAVLTANLTPALIQALIFFAALLLFLYGRVRLRRTIILAFPRRRQRLR